MFTIGEQDELVVDETRWIIKSSASEPHKQTWLNALGIGVCALCGEEDNTSYEKAV